MRILQIFLILIAMVGMIGLYDNVFAISQPNVECQPGSICVHPGDFITYSTKYGDAQTAETYIFGEYIGTDKINLSISSFENGNLVQSNNILDLKTGFYNETSDSSGFPIIIISEIPIQIDKNQAGYSEKTFNFTGTQRIVVSASNTTETSSGELAYDKETGVLMYLHLTNHPLLGQTTPSPELTPEIRYDLVDTNMFPVSAPQVELQIPTWVKNNAKWWSQGQLEDSEFVKGIQYLINEGIVKIPQTTSDPSLSQQIPSWVKSNAGWWSSGQISDTEFIKGIEYLASNGLIHV